MIDTGHGRRKPPSPKMRTETNDDPLSADTPGIGTSHTVTERNLVCEAGMHASEGGRSDEPLIVPHTIRHKKITADPVLSHYAKR